MTDLALPLPAVRVRALLAGSMTQIRLPAWKMDCGNRVQWPPTRWQRVKAGDRLWVREAWQAPALCPVQYRATDTARIGHWDPAHGPWRSSTTMPRHLSRLTLTVTAPPRMEPLHSISEEDAGAEGLALTEEEIRLNEELMRRELLPHIRAIGGDKKYPLTAGGKFVQLWCDLNGGFDAWEENPEVVALSFRTTHANIDASEAA